MTQIKLLQIIFRDPRGGIYRVNLDLIEAFIDEPDFSLHIAQIESKTYRGEFDFDKHQPEYTEISGRFFRKFRKLKALAEQFDIIHLHGFTPWIAIAIWFSSAKIVFTNHGLMGKGRNLKVHEYLKRYLLKLYLRHKVHRIVNISKYAMHNLTERYIVKPEKNSIVFNCTRWSRSKINISSNGTITIGFHGRFVGFKRVDRLLQVAALVQKLQKCKIILLGDGPLKQEYQILAKYLNLNLSFIDYSANPLLEMQNFDVEILASDDEYFGVSVLESIQAGIPIFVFKNGGGCTEIFGTEFSSFICEDEKGMARKILEFFEPKNRIVNQAKLRQLQEHVEQNFSLEGFKKGYSKVYLQVLEDLR